VLVGGMFAVFICRVFKPSAQPAYIIGLGIFLVSAAYGLDFLRKNNRSKPPDG